MILGNSVRRDQLVAVMTKYDCDSVADAVEISSTLALKQDEAELAQILADLLSEGLVLADTGHLSRSLFQVSDVSWSDYRNRCYFYGNLTFRTGRVTD